jgi:adenylyltransferase/sulfurtransferase
MIEAIAVKELKVKLGSGVNFVLLDVRQPEEAASASMMGSVLIPLGELPSRLYELDRASEIVVYCRSGARSMRACVFLEKNGFKNVKNLSGGMLAWMSF